MNLEQPEPAMPTTDPMKRDVAAAKAELMAVHETYGRTDEIAYQRGGQAHVRARLAELDRINDIFAECEQLDRLTPDGAEAMVLRFAYPYRGRSVS
jgi:hypothetical protein